VSNFTTTKMYLWIIRFAQPWHYDFYVPCSLGQSIKFVNLLLKLLGQDEQVLLNGQFINDPVIRLAKTEKFEFLFIDKLTKEMGMVPHPTIIMNQEWALFLLNAPNTKMRFTMGVEILDANDFTGARSFTLQPENLYLLDEVKTRSLWYY